MGSIGLQGADDSRSQTWNAGHWNNSEQVAAAVAAAVPGVQQWRLKGLGRSQLEGPRQ